MKLGLFFDLRNPGPWARPSVDHVARSIDLVTGAEAAGIDMVVCLAGAVPDVRRGSNRLFVTAAIDFGGEITVDEGAVAAMMARGSSLLPKGIREVKGDFSRGEVIRIRNLAGRDLAHGVSRYNSDAMRMIAGHHSQEIDDILGYEYGPVAVHRDDMITR